MYRSWRAAASSRTIGDVDHCAANCHVPGATLRLMYWLSALRPVTPVTPVMNVPWLHTTRPLAVIEVQFCLRGIPTVACVPAGETSASV